jgi:hypothetical protein
MRIKMKQIISLILCLVLVVSVNLTSYANANDNNDYDFTYYDTNVLGEIIIGNQVANITKNTDDLLEVEAEKDGVTCIVEFNKNTDDIKVNIKDNNEVRNSARELSEKEFSYDAIVNIEDIENEKYTITYVDEETKQEITIDENSNFMVRYALPQAIPIGVNLAKLVIHGIVIATSAVVCLTIDNDQYKLLTQDVAEELEKNQNYVYFRAYRLKDLIYVGSGLTVHAASFRVSTSLEKNVITLNKQLAEAAAALGAKRAYTTYYWEDKHQDKPYYFAHFHLKDISKKKRFPSHIWHLN